MLLLWVEIAGKNLVLVQKWCYKNLVLVQKCTKKNLVLVQSVAYIIYF